MFLKAMDTMEQYDLSVSYFLEEDLKLLEIEPSEKKDLKDWVSVDGIEPLVSMMLLDLKTYLPDDILVKVDRQP
jgi:asparagine synthase (glutamine-hydrolysing)